LLPLRRGCVHRYFVGSPILPRGSSQIKGGMGAIVNTMLERPGVEIGVRLGRDARRVHVAEAPQLL
jgi:hypothetical protein